MSNTRNFVLRDENDNEHGVFTGKQPRQAALKAANRGTGTKDQPDIIRLRERGTKKVHVFKAWKEFVEAPKNRPNWMPEKISKPFVKKEKIEKIE
ncbi:MAG: non-histone chromosomal MC1 family protein [Methanosarcinaceae archaeon]|nr:non-histone chromosomal MC1 family protein [Methanosarcinaceae archaeon]MDD4498046.1 non-histone chromosomal MC1 family protein [Methanosarcinaceae archaeon]